MLFYVFVALAALYLFYHAHWKRRNLPPGPMPLPIFGNTLSFLRRLPDAQFQEWAKQYGDVYTYWMGDIPVVSTNSHKANVELFVKQADHSSDRYSLREFEDYSRQGARGVINLSGEEWRTQRRFALQVFRDFGMGKNMMQDRVMDEVEDIVGSYRTKLAAGVRLFDFPNDINRMVGSVINSLLFGYRFAGPHEHEFADLEGRMGAVFRASFHPVVMMAMTSTNLFTSIPWLSGPVKRIRANYDVLLKFWSDQIKEHAKELDLDSHEPARDFVEAYMREDAKRRPEGNQSFDEIHLLGQLHDLWVAGHETTGNTLGWAVGYMVNYPDVQQKCQAELDAVIGSSRWVLTDDRASLPYINATINEIQRVANIVPQAVLRQASAPVTVKGFSLPTGTVLLPQFSVALYDEKVTLIYAF